MSSPENGNVTQQVGRYGIAGALNSVVGFSVIFGLQALGVLPWIANAIGYAIGFVIAFTLQKVFVFESAERMSSELKRFVVAFVLAFSANQLTLYALLSLGVNPYLAQLTAIGVYIVSMFFLSRNWVFRASSR